MLDFLVIIQARLESTRLPGKVLMTVGGTPMVKRVWMAAKSAMSGRKAKVIVAWPERYPDLDQNNVLERFRRISNEFPSKYIIRLTSDCPLIEENNIIDAIDTFEFLKYEYYSNHKDGFDVQVFNRGYLMSDVMTHREHVIADFMTLPTGYSVNTKEDLQRIRAIAK